jgi:thiosulfate reductase/polysulfide reductase chain A
MASRLGLEDFFPWKDPDDHLAQLMRPLKIDMAELKALGAVSFEGHPYIEDRTPQDGPLFPTQSGKIELSSSVLKDLKIDPLPTYEPVEQPPPGFLRLIYGRAPVHSFARSENNAWLDDLMPENQVWVNREVAAQLKVRDGQKVILENQDGVRSASIAVIATPGIRRDCAYMVHGFGTHSKALTKAYGKGASDAQLMTRIAIDPIMGGTGMRVNFVRVIPASEG